VTDAEQGRDRTARQGSAHGSRLGAVQAQAQAEKAEVVAVVRGVGDRCGREVGQRLTLHDPTSVFTSPLDWAGSATDEA